ncbi:hypothetical protein ACHAXR_000969, partial [Thalassiosira sp. AJA248-18]
MVVADSDEDYQQQQHFLRCLFTNDDDEEEEESSHNDIISKHTWTCPNNNNNSSSTTTTSIIYHLAFLAPGHGDSLWNSSMCIAQHLLLPEYRSILFPSSSSSSSSQNHWPPKRCIEFGAGAALPSLVLLKEGAKRVIVTDKYINEQTFDALRMSVDENAKLWGMSDEEVEGRVDIMPHTWGEDVEKLLVTQQDQQQQQQQQQEEAGDDGRRSGDHPGCSSDVACCDDERADLLIASDCIYNPTYHKALLQS